MARPVFLFGIARPLVGIVALCTVSVVHAQSVNPTSVSVSYYGDSIFHPGLKVSGERVVLGSVRPGERHAFATLGLAAGGYHRATSHTGLFVGAEFGYAAVTRGGFTVMTALGAGIHRSVVDGTTYVVADDGDVREASLVGQTTLMLTAGAGLGKQFRNSPISVHVRPTLTFRTPYNTSVLPEAHLEVGIRYRLR
ncbi:MAG: hypothetical protein Rubg2KO_38190 [Rubricoccaceae bacterium]